MGQKYLQRNVLNSLLIIINFQRVPTSWGQFIWRWNKLSPFIIHQDDDVFRCSNYRGPRPHREEEDPLAGELMNCKYSTGEVNKDSDMNRYVLLDYKNKICCKFESRSGKVYSIQHYVIKFVSDLRQISGFLQVIRFTPPIKLTATI